jgi:hypothetical protein
VQKPRVAVIGLAGCLWGAALLTVTSAGPSPTTQLASPLIDFQKQIQPILAEACLECHSQDKRKGGLSLATYADVLEGGRSGAVVRPGASGRSLIVDRLTGSVEPQMPKDELALGDPEIALIRLWIDQGARATPSSAPAPPPWEAPLALSAPSLPAIRWASWKEPIDLFVADHLASRKRAAPTTISDARFARRAYLDVWGLLPTPEDLQTFLADRSPTKREALVTRLLADNDRYAQHWISFWNDLLRNEDGVSYFSETAGRKAITDWLLASLVSNVPYDQFVKTLLNPVAPTDPDGFLIGVNWRGETSAAVTPWMQAGQNSAQIFLGVNLKCNACHDSFVSKWKLKDAYALAAFFSPEPKLRLYRCDVAQEVYAEPGFLFPELDRRPPSDAIKDRTATAAAIFTDPRNGRLARTVVNRLWHRLLGYGIVSNPDEMDGKPWSPALLDWLASDLVAHNYDLKHTIRTILMSRSYQMPAVARRGEPPSRQYAFDGPEVRRMTAEQFADAIGALTGEWNLRPTRSGPTGGAIPGPTGSDPLTFGTYAREWRVASSNLSRALGRPIRDQVISFRGHQATTPQALELVNGELLTRWLARGAQRMIGELPPEPRSLFNKTVAGRNATSSKFEIDISKASRLWLIVDDFGSNAPERVLPMWADAELVGPSGTLPLSSLTPTDSANLRGGIRPASLGSGAEPVRIMAPSRLVYDISGRGFTRFRGTMAIENTRSEIGSTLNPQVRFLVFDTEPNVSRLLPPAPDPPLPPGPVMKQPGEIVDRVFRQLLGRAPTVNERTLAARAIANAARPSEVSAEGLSDLLWAVLMKPEFQLIY